jgi:hypothetical protein
VKHFRFLQKKTQRFVAGSFAMAALAFTAQAAPAAELLVGSTDGNKLVFFSSDNPKKVKVMKLRGLAPNEKLLGLDTRPANGQLYALGSTSQIYIVSLGNQAVATPVGGPFNPALEGDFHGFDFNPQADRIRIISDANQNLRVNPDTGAAASVDGDLAYDAADPNAGQDPGGVAACYDNNDNDPNTPTTLFDIDASRDVLVMQNPPNNGTLLTVGSLGVSTQGSLHAHCDIAASDGTAYAVLQSHDNRSRLYTIDLTTGAATLIDTISGPTPLTSLATLGAM